ncbi:MAG: zinc ribbon domain-containing protein [Pyrinomonadaceae bacterium]
MHCPRCGQQQISQETKFCSRCGFQMGLIPHLIANNGVLPQLAELYKGKTGWFTRKNGLIFTALWFIFFVMMMPAFFGIADLEEGAAVSAVFGVFSTMMLLITSLAFLKRSPKRSEISQFELLQQMPQNLHGNQAPVALPPQQMQPAQVYAPPQAGGWRAPDTGDFARPHSVTDNTTKLLQKDEDK